MTRLRSHHALGTVVETTELELLQSELSAERRATAWTTFALGLSTAGYLFLSHIGYQREAVSFAVVGGIATAFISAMRV
jgi:hypothetical protein